jgi:hypothetical protein
MGGRSGGRLLPAAPAGGVHWGRARPRAAWRCCRACLAGCLASRGPRLRGSCSPMTAPAMGKVCEWVRPCPPARAGGEPAAPAAGNRRWRAGRPARRPAAARTQQLAGPRTGQPPELPRRRVAPPGRPQAGQRRSSSCLGDRTPWAAGRWCCCGGGPAAVARMPVLPAGGGRTQRGVMVRRSCARDRPTYRGGRAARRSRGGCRADASSGNQPSSSSSGAAASGRAGGS